jgi:benzoyl-CoA reductase/2-hydroxyglutaryl-CoA dehydratase subunit BcrC/BadD/HgdB
MTSIEKKNRVETIVRSLGLISRMNNIRPEISESQKLYYRMLLDYYTQLLKVKEENRFVVAHSIFFPVELIYGMGLVPMHSEVTAWMTALFSGSYMNLLAKAAGLGLAPEICSPHRVLHGAFAAGSLPRPDAVVWTNLVCENCAKSGGLIMEANDCPGFFLDCPFQRTPREDKYLVDELQELVGFLEQKSGQKMDPSELSRRIAESNRQIELYREIDLLRRNVPSPLPFQDFLKLFTVDCLFSGQPEATLYLETLRKELTEKVRAGRGAVHPERFRLMNLSMPPIPLINAIDKILEENGVACVTDPFLCTWEEGELNRKDPITGVVDKLLMLPLMVMYGPLDNRVLDRILDCAQKHRIDGAMNFAHVGCGQSAAMIKYVKDALNEIGVPVLIIDCDIIDTTIAPEDEIKQKLVEFFELLEEK